MYPILFVPTGFVWNLPGKRAKVDFLTDWDELCESRALSLWGHHWEVSLCGLWGFLQERETIGGTSCCGSWCDSRSAQAGHRLSSALPQFITALYSAADLCVCVFNEARGRFSLHHKVSTWHSEYNERHLQYLFDEYVRKLLISLMHILHVQYLRSKSKVISVI